MYEKKLKRGKDGLFTRYVGQNARGVPEKFRLGYDQDAAEEKVRLIAALWTEIEGRTPRAQPFLGSAQPGGGQGDRQRQAPGPAQAGLRGPDQVRPAGRRHQPEPRARRSSQATRSSIKPDWMTSGRNRRGPAEALRRHGRPRRHWVTVRQAMDAYEAHVRRSLTLPNGYLRPWGRTKLDQLDSIRNYLADERFGGRDYLSLDLADLSLRRCDEMYGVFRRRPLTLRSKLRSG